METPTELNAKSIPLKCGCVTSPVYTLAGAPTIPEPKPTSNLPPKKKKNPQWIFFFLVKNQNENSRKLTVDHVNGIC